MNETTQVAVVQEAKTIELGLLRSSTPEELLEAAAAIATPLRKFIEAKGLAVHLRGKTNPPFVTAEGWTTLLAMLGVMPQEVSVVEENTDAGSKFIAKVELVRMSDGQVITRGSAECSSDEPNWGTRPSFQLRSMAITRAVGKAARMGFSWIMTLAGYSPTPAEEMIHDHEVERAQVEDVPPAAPTSGEKGASTRKLNSWTERILNAKDGDELTHIGKEISGEGGLLPHDLDQLRAAWAGKMEGLS